MRKASAKKVLVDHHRDPEDFADFSFWDPQGTILVTFGGLWKPFGVHLGASGDHFGDQVVHVCTQGVPGGCRDVCLMIFAGFWVPH